jgi:hypothetical protein
MSVSVVAPKVRHSIAQGETLGMGKTQNVVALKWRHSDRPLTEPWVRQPLGEAPGSHAPLGLTILLPPLTQGSAALHPGLSNMTPSGSEFGGKKAGRSLKLVANSQR